TIMAAGAEQDGSPTLIGHSVTMGLGDAVDQTTAVNILSLRKSLAIRHSLCLVGFPEDVRRASAWMLRRSRSVIGSMPGLGCPSRRGPWRFGGSSSTSNA